MKINATWHKKHPMPPRATLAQRVTWHVAHAKHCACRPIPAGIRPHLRTKSTPKPRPHDSRR